VKPPVARSRWGPALGTIVFTVLVPGTVAGLIPWWVAGDGHGPAWLEGLLPGAIGVMLLVLGIAGYLWCARDFVVRGLGTPAPIAEPRRLVIHGLYAYSRNPMYLSVLLVIVGQGLLLASTRVLGYAVVVWAFFYSFVMAYEEPRLQHLFGDEYVRYMKRVPRWLGLRRAPSSGGEQQAT
jgi:protein-S-isoprenylcysteine O-methyltransferase Ste14